MVKVCYIKTKKAKGAILMTGQYGLLVCQDAREER